MLGNTWGANADFAVADLETAPVGFLVRPGVKRGDDDEATNEPEDGTLVIREGVAYADCEDRNGVPNCALIVCDVGDEDC